MGLHRRSSKSVESEAALKGSDVPQVPLAGAIIDKKSMTEYRQQVEKHRGHNGHASDADLLQLVKEYIKKKIDGIVDEACRKRIMDLTTVGLSVMSSTVIPFSGVAVVVAATLMQCLNFSVTLGLIPLLNMRSFSDLTAMSKQIGTTIKRASKSSLMAGVETAVLEILKNLAVGDWLWVDILKDILVDVIGDSAMDATWIMTPVLAVPKYMLHRHLIKKMYRKLGDKAHVVHHTWTETNCIKGVEVRTTGASQVGVDAYGNVQGAYVQSQAVSAPQAGAAAVSQTNAHFQLQNDGAAQAQVTQTNAYFQQPNGGAPQVQVTQTNAYFQQQNGGAPQVQASQSSACFQQQAPPQQQWPAYPPSSQSSSGIVPGYPQVPMQPECGSNPPAKQVAAMIMGYAPPANSSFFQPQAPPKGIQIMGHTAPANSSFFQPQVQAGGYFHAAAAAAQTCTPPPNPTYFQQPYGNQQTQTIYPPAQGTPYQQTQTIYPPAQGTPYQQTQTIYPPAQGTPYQQTQTMYPPAQGSEPAWSTPGYPQFSPYGPVGEYNKMQAPMAHQQRAN